MTESDLPGSLEERLERLRGAGASGCVPAYETLGKDLAGERRFLTALARMRALADPNRLLAAALLRRRGELCACEIQAATGLSHATVSHHMARLIEVGLVRARRQGKWVHYRLADRPHLELP